MKRIYSFLFVVLFSFSLMITTLFAQPEGISVVKSNNGYIVNFSLQQYNFTSIAEAGSEYIDIKIPGYGVTPDVGMPALPQISFNLFIPSDEQKPTISINSFDQSTQILDKKVYPKQMYWSRERSLSERPFVINSDYYNSTGIEKPLVNISEPFVIGGVSGVMVTVFPFSYNPKENKLSITNSATFEIKVNAELESPVYKSEAYNEFLKKCSSWISAN